MTKRWSPIPRIEVPRFGMPLRSVVRYDHRRLRKARLAQLTANPLCNRCGRAAEHVHHKIPILQGGHPYDFGNLESLCLDCHHKAHGKRVKPLLPPPG